MPGWSRSRLLAALLDVGTDECFGVFFEEVVDFIQYGFCFILQFLPPLLAGGFRLRQVVVAVRVVMSMLPFSTQCEAKDLAVKGHFGVQCAADGIGPTGGQFRARAALDVGSAVT